MAKSSDKETYSVDEMMDKLRESQREKEGEDKGKLVIREDGSQAMRVRKKKRRTKQQKKASAAKKKNRKILRLLLLLSIPFLLAITLLIFLARYHSPSFTQGLVVTSWEKTGADIRVSGLSPIVNRVSGKRVFAKWPDGNRLDQLQALELSGSLNPISFFTGNLRGRNLSSVQGYLVVSERENRKISKPKGSPVKATGFTDYSCNEFSFYFGRKNSAFQLEDSRVRFVPKDYGQQLFLSGGVLKAGSWGELPIERGTLEFAGDNVEMVSFRLKEEERHMILSGNLNLNDPKHQLTVEIAEGNIGNVGGFGLGEYMEASLNNSEGTLSFDSWEESTHELVVECSPDYLRVKGFPFMGLLEEIYGDPRFKDFEFEVEESFELVRGSGWVELRNLNLTEVGVFCLRGNLRIEGKKVSGDLKIGLPRHKKALIHPGQKEAFVANSHLEDGYFWFDVSLSGQVLSPRDNFLQMIEKPSGKKKSQQDLFDLLTQ